MTTFQIRIYALCAFLMTSALWAEEAEEEKPTWTDQAELSLVATAGNSETETFSLKNTLAGTWEKSSFTFTVEALRAETTERFLTNPDGTVTEIEVTSLTAEKYGAGAAYKYQLRGTLDGYVDTGWQRNRLTGIDARYDVGLGVSYAFIETDPRGLVGEIGITWIDEERIDGFSEDFLSGRGFLGYRQAFGADSAFEGSLEVLQNFDDSDDLRALGKLSVSTKMTTRLALKVSYESEWRDRPVTLLVEPDAGAPPGTPAARFEFDDLDTTFSIALVIDF